MIVPPSIHSYAASVMCYTLTVRGLFCGAWRIRFGSVSPVGPGENVNLFARRNFPRARKPRIMLYYYTSSLSDNILNRYGYINGIYIYAWADNKEIAGYMTKPRVLRLANSFPDVFPYTIIMVVYSKLVFSRFKCDYEYKI